MEKDDLYKLAENTWTSLTNSDKFLSFQLFKKRHDEWGNLSNDDKLIMMELVRITTIEQAKIMNRAQIDSMYPETIGVYTLIPYAEWMAEADRVFEHELVEFGSSPSQDSIMRRAHSYMLHTVPNKTGGIGGIYVQPGWQQAMQRRG